MTPPRGGRPPVAPGSDVLVGADGNAFAIMGVASRALHRAGASPEYVNRYLAAAQEGDYDNLLAVTVLWLDTDTSGKEPDMTTTTAPDLCECGAGPFKSPQGRAAHVRSHKAASKPREFFSGSDRAAPVDPAKEPTRAKRSKTPLPCTCECGGMTKGGKFLPGHDARYYSRMGGHK